MADGDIEAVFVLMMLVIVASARRALMGRKKTKKKRKVWVRPWIQCRQLYGAYSTLFKELAEVDQHAFSNFVRMDVAAFEDLLYWIEHDLTKQHTRMRRSLSGREQLCIALRYLATGISEFDF